MTTDTLLSTGEVAKALGVTPGTIGRWVRAGKIQAVKLPSGRNRFRRETIAEIAPIPLSDVGID